METTHAQALQLQDVLLFLAVAGLLVPLLRHCRVNAVLAFLLSGVALGPHGFGALASDYPWLRALVIQDAEGAQALAELGVVTLLFLIGLELSWQRLWQMHRWIFGLGSAQLLLCAGVIGGIALAFGNSPAASVVLGGCLALSSTAVVMQLLNEQRALGAPLGQASFAILLLQDLAVVPLLLLVGLLGNTSDGALWQAVGIAFGKALAAVVLIAGCGHWLLRPLFHRIARQQRAETFMALTLLSAIGTAALTHAFGLSLALGAFLAGVLLAESEFRHQIEVNLEPFNGLLMGLFFMAVGMNIDLKMWLVEPLWLMASVFGLMLIKGAIVAALLRLQGFSWAEGLRGGLLLSQAGEFGFIVVSMAVSLSILPEDTGQFMMLVVSSTMLLTPLANVLGNALVARVLTGDTPTNPTPEMPKTPHVLIAGCGRVGQLVAGILNDEKQPWIAVEHNVDLVSRLRERGFPVVYGDVAQAELLHKLHAERALAVVVTVDSPEASERAVAAIRKQFPHTPIFARARDFMHARTLLALGATDIVPDTLEAGLQLSGLTLSVMGASEEARHLLLEHRRTRELESMNQPG